MDIDKIIAIASFVLTIIVFAWGLYQKVKGDAAKSVSSLIAVAETTGLVGKDKMELVVSWLYEKIPVPFKTILSKDTLEDLAQGVFDYMRKYADAYVSTKNGTGTISFDDVNNELTAEIANRLAGIGSVSIKALAVALGINVDGKTDAELIQSIVTFLLATIGTNEFDKSEE